MRFNRMEWNRNLCPFYISDGRRYIRCKSPVGMIAETVTEFEQAEKKEAFLLPLSLHRPPAEGTSQIKVVHHHAWA